MLKSLLLTLPFLAAFSAFSQTAEVTISDALVREFLPAAPSSAAYFSIENKGDKALVLTAASVEQIGRVEIHKHSHVDGMMKMVKVPEVAIKGHDSLVFQPGGYHLMLFDPQSKLKAGQKLKLTLHFKNADSASTMADVVSIEQQAEKEAPSHQHHH